MKKIILSLVLVVGVLFLAGCSDIEKSTQGTESKKQEEIQKKLVKTVPTPDIKNSTARKAIAQRAKLFDANDKITYIYLINYGKVMAFYSVKGQPVSLRAYLTPMENIVNNRGVLCTDAARGDNTSPSCYGGDGYLVGAPDVDGTYGDTVDGIFFFTTEGAYVEWKGDYMVSDQPLKLTQQPELIREIK
ncbi:MAG TPA: hypothetical protein DDY52_03385 [Candidatus Moranbacteria bacterium]|nr:hypothetical protein [Candidatus Moranbacteria bacterium]